MATKKQIIPLLVSTQGTNTGVDPKINSGIHLVENGVWDREGKISKRYGFSASALTDEFSYIFPFHNAAIIAQDLPHKYAVVHDANAYQILTNDTNIYAPHIHTMDRLNIQTRYQDVWLYSDVAKRADIVGVCYTELNRDDSKYYVNFETFHSNDGIRIDAAIATTTPSTVPDAGKVVALGDYIYCFFWDSLHRLRFYRADSTGNIDTTANCFSAVMRSATYKTFDVCFLPRDGSSPYVMVICVSNNANKVRLATISTGGALVSNTEITTTNQPTHVGCAWKSDTKAIISWVEDNTSTQDGYAGVYTDALAADTSAQLVFTADNTDYTTMNISCGCDYDKDDDSFFVATTEMVEATSIPRVRIVRLKNGSAQSTNIAAGCGALVTKPAYLGLGVTDTSLMGIYTEGFNSNSNQRTLLLGSWMDGSLYTSGVAIAGFTHYDSDGYLGTLPNFVHGSDGYSNLASDGYYTIAPYVLRETLDAYQSDKQLAIVDPTAISTYGLCVLKINDPPHNISHIATNTTLMVGSTAPQATAGTSFFGHGFWQWPENISSSISGSSGLDDGDYYYRFCFEVVDEQGQINRSGFNRAPVLVTVSSGPKQVNLTLPSYPLDPRDVVCVVWRTLKNTSAPFYRVGHISATDSTQTHSYTDTTADSVLIYKEAVNITLDQQPMTTPPYSVSTLWGDQVWIVDKEWEAIQLWYSKPITAGEPVVFTYPNSLTVFPEGGSITALYPLGNLLFVFKENKTLAIQNTGLTDVRGIGSFSYPQVVNPSVGCKDQRSIVRIPSGIMFLASSGIWAMSNGGEMSFLGKPVEYYTDTYTYHRGVSLPEQNTALWFCNDGYSLAYDYDHDKWSIWEGLEAKDACVTDDGQLYFLDTTGQYLYSQDTSVYTDNSTHIPLKITTSWISAAGLGGYQLIKRLLVLGENLKDHTLQVKVAYDYAPYWEDTYTFDASNLLTFSESSYYGAGLGATYADQGYLIDLELKRQNCTSVRFEISDTQTGTYDEAWTISAIAIEVAAKGRARLGTSRKF